MRHVTELETARTHASEQQELREAGDALVNVRHEL